MPEDRRPVPDRLAVRPLPRSCSTRTGRGAAGGEGLLYIAGPSVFQGLLEPARRERRGVRRRDGAAGTTPGDVVREEPGEGYIYLGRRDRMVKRRGYRIELGEIERALYQHPRVRLHRCAAADIDYHQQGGLRCCRAVTVGMNRPARSGADPRFNVLRGTLRALHERDGNVMAEADVAGYYEGLLAGQPRTLLGRARNEENYRFRGDFLYFEARENVDWPEHDDSGRHITNSLGISDREYGVTRRPGTRRLAIVGDSIARGQGAPFGQNFESLLEIRLNERHRDAVVEEYELLNFSTTAYRVTQMLDFALERIPPFEPDVYVVCLSRLSVGVAWGDHLAQLVYDGIDLKYPFLQELAAEARLNRRDSIATMREKLEPLRIPVIRWVLQEFRELARREGATLVVAFIPSANTPESLEPGFTAVREVVAELNLPLIDLLHVFGGTPLSHVRVAADNVHPNAEGHRQIFEAFYDAILADERLAEIVLGASAREAGSPQAGTPSSG
jgi:hypothetical protein